MPKGTSQEKIDQINFYDGQCHFVEAKDIYSEAARLAKAQNGHYMDQFTFAERATDWRGNNNIAESIFTQMQRERFAEPSWIVISAGTGGTSATIGCYLRYKRRQTRLCVPDPQNSVFYDAFQTGDSTLTFWKASNIEGIGRPRVEPSFLPSVIDRMIKVPDAAAYATIHFLEKLLNRKCGGSTGTNVYAAFQLISELNQRGENGSVVSMICDGGERYLETYYNEGWLQEKGFDLTPYREQLGEFYETGILPEL